MLLLSCKFGKHFVGNVRNGVHLAAKQEAVPFEYLEESTVAWYGDVKQVVVVVVVVSQQVLARSVDRSGDDDDDDGRESQGSV